MEEIAKVRRVIRKADPSAPHETLLVLDANFGQNALSQVKAFDRAIGISGLIVTKLDGTAKGGAIAAIARQCPKPIRYIGVGEGIDDLRPFVARDFVEAMFSSA
jgi:fused signal recognition particle receptor